MGGVVGSYSGRGTPRCFHFEATADAADDDETLLVRVIEVVRLEVAATRLDI